MIVAVLAGLGFGLSLIVAIGAQNAFVLRQGLRREYVAAIVLLCTASDAVLITAGVGGLGALVRAAPDLLTVARFGGAAVMLGYAVLAARRAVRPGTLRAGASTVSISGYWDFDAQRLSFVRPVNGSDLSGLQIYTGYLMTSGIE